MLFFRKLFLFLVSVAVYATHVYAQNSTQVQKRDGKFSGAITATTEDTRNTTYPNLVGSIELRFVWSGIFDQPTEYYQFVWKPSGRIAYAGATFNRSRLNKYPDLARRFDGLRPRNVKLTMDIVFGDAINLNCVQGYASGTGCITRFSKTITEVPHLMVASAGQLGDNITPTSPVDNWLGFFETGALRGDAGTINSKLQGMMRSADSIRVSNLKLVSYEVSPSRVAAIIEEFYKREDEEAEREIAEEEAENSAANEDDGESLFDKVKDFFSGDDDKAEDDFWSGGSDSREKARSAQPESDDDFWSGGSNKKSKGSTKSSRRTQAQNDQVIVEKNGVKTASGKILIPYRDWLVRSFKDGVAVVSIIERSSDLSVGDCGKVTGYRSTTGSVNNQGEWIELPYKKVFIKRNRSTPKYIWEQVKGMGYSDRKAVLNSWHDSCKPKFDRAAREFESRFN